MIDYTYNPLCIEAEQKLAIALQKAPIPVGKDDEEEVSKEQPVHATTRNSKREAGDEGGRITVAKAFTLIGGRVMLILFDTGALPSVLRLDT